MVVDRYRPSSEDLESFINQLRSCLSIILGSSLYPSNKDKITRLIFRGFRDTSGTRINKMSSIFSLPGDFVEGKLDPVANKNTSHLAEYLYYNYENITPEVVVEMNELGLDERYNRAFKASQNLSFVCCIFSVFLLSSLNSSNFGAPFAICYFSFELQPLRSRCYY